MTPQEQNQHDPIVAQVCQDLQDRSRVGIAKYGTTLAREDLSLKDWLIHAYEETLDKANYLKAAILKLEAEEKPDIAEAIGEPEEEDDEEWEETRYCFGCNGEDGYHYAGCPEDDSPFANLIRDGYD